LNCFWQQDKIVAEQRCYNDDSAGVRHDHAAQNRNIWRKWALNSLRQVSRQTGQATQSLMRKSAMSRP
jgi:hypothetical protein